MKKIITVIFMMLICLTSYSQHLLGESYRDVKKAMSEKGFKIEEGPGNSKGVNRITASDNSEYRIYFFKEDNVCYAFRAIKYGFPLSVYKEFLKSNGFNKSNDGSYANKTLRAELVYSSDINEWIITITFI